VRFFNTAGVCFPDRHYMVPAEPRLHGARRLVDQGQYFVVHAPRQTGKTTSLRALAHALTAEGRYAAVYTTCEVGRAAGDDYGAAQESILSLLRSQAEYGLPEPLRPPPWPETAEGERVRSALAAWAAACPRPLVVFFDEIDALGGASLLSVLSQLRAGSADRPAAFPHSVAVCGLRDASVGDAFNISAESLRLGDFGPEQVRSLYRQHTEETGQVFTEEALQRAFDYSRGQPWLVNSLAREVIEKMETMPPTPITAEHIDEAKERLILARQTHLDSLVDKLTDPRVRRIIEPLIAGDFLPTEDAYNDDLAYLRDLGLIAPGRPVRVANPVYREVIVRVLGESTEDMILAEPRSFVLPDGRLDFRRLLAEFADFWCQHGEILERRDFYHEAAPQLAVMTFLHRVVNGGGYVDREYGIGRGRIDLTVRWPYRNADGVREWQREPIELKVWRPGGPDPTTVGLRQLDDYLDRIRAHHGTLVVFDRRPEAPPPHERTTFATTQTPSGHPITLLRA
jgi:hypothetical protein